MAIAANKEACRKRVDRFFKSNKTQVSSVVDLLELMSGYGEVYIFGGLLRDIALEGVVKFQSSSDIDIVFSSSSAICKSLEERGGVKNKFGGYRLTAGIWSVDAWAIEETWAFREGYVRFEGVESLLNTTITNWESILFEWRSKKVICKDVYFTDLNEGLLDICLENNPNPLGFIVRILRLHAKAQVNFLTPKASLSYKKLIDEYTYKDITKYEKKVYLDRHINKNVYESFNSNKHFGINSLIPIRVRSAHVDDFFNKYGEYD